LPLLIATTVLQIIPIHQLIYYQNTSCSTTNK